MCNFRKFEGQTKVKLKIREVKGEGKTASWGTYNLNQILAEQIIRQSIIRTYIPFYFLEKYILSYDPCRIFPL